jgi:hypothetical protein
MKIAVEKVLPARLGKAKKLHLAQEVIIEIFRL